MIINAPAKLNLTFEIPGRREDGYHNIKSVMQTVDIYDHLEITPSDHLELTGAMVAPPEDNIITRAIWMLQGFVGRSLPCKIHLDKTIPIGAGMGGGSSDAAAVLYALNQLYDLGLCIQDLLKVGAQVGADVPFFLVGGKCLVEGIGEKVTPLDPDDGSFLYLVFRPHKRLSSREAYEEYDRTGKTFDQMAREKCPQLETVLQAFIDVTISGKGPTVWVKKGEYWATVKACPVRGELEALDAFIRSWDGDIFLAHPVPGCCHYTIQELKSLWEK